jgi:hypothetical protein
MKFKSGEYGNIRTFARKKYYFPIGLSKRADNPNLVQVIQIISISLISEGPFSVLKQPFFKKINEKS